MINLHHERLITLTQAAKYVPGRDGNEHVHPATVYRWATRGCRGKVLDTVMPGGRRMTSRDALQRFMAAVAEPSRRNNVEAAEQTLAEAGI